MDYHLPGLDLLAISDFPHSLSYPLQVLGSLPSRGLQSIPLCSHHCHRNQHAFLALCLNYQYLLSILIFIKIVQTCGLKSPIVL